MGSMHHARRTGRHVSGGIQQCVPDHACSRDVVIYYEMIHEARIIPIDGRPHLPSSVKLWNGDSRGRWEGNTLVVDTTNYNNKGWIATSAATGRIKGIPQSEALHVVERFTPPRCKHDQLRSDNRRPQHVHAAVEGVESVDA
jgi:hypothetical protein